jgi:phosphoribosylanthranilate isomerase
MFGGKRSARIQVKICGISNFADAVMAVDCGADAIGLNLYPGSTRYLDIEKARDWVEKLPATICKVAVLVDPMFEEAIRVSELGFIDALQLHGQESPEFCRGLAERGIQFAKALPVADESSLLNVPFYHTGTIVLDTATAGKFGGSGRTFPWQIARRFVEKNPLFNVILAGGLTPDNVVQAIDEVRPFGVDVTSGIETGHGRKDHQRLRLFIERAKRR